MLQLITTLLFVLRGEHPLRPHSTCPADSDQAHGFEGGPAPLPGVQDNYHKSMCLWPVMCCPARKTFTKLNATTLTAPRTSTPRGRLTPAGQHGVLRAAHAPAAHTAVLRAAGQLPFWDQPHCADYADPAHPGGLDGWKAATCLRNTHSVFYSPWVGVGSPSSLTQSKRVCAPLAAPENPYQRPCICVWCAAVGCLTHALV